MLASWPKGNVAQGCSWVCQGKEGYGYWRLPLLLTLFASCPPTLSRSVTGPALHACAFAELTAAVTTVKQPADKIAALENMTQRSAWDVRAGM